MKNTQDHRFLEYAGIITSGKLKEGPMEKVRVKPSLKVTIQSYDIHRTQIMTRTTFHVKDKNG